MIKSLVKRVVNGLAHIRKYPIEAIEFTIFALLVIWAVVSLLPPKLFLVTSAYGDYHWVRLIFGSIMLYISAQPVYWRIRRGIDEYVLTYQQKRRKHLFYAIVVWTYIGILRFAIAPIYPPYFFLYLAMAFISLVCYIRLGK